MSSHTNHTPRRGDAPAAGKATRTRSRPGLGTDEARGASLGAGAPTPLARSGDSASSADNAPRGHAHDTESMVISRRPRRNLILDWLMTRPEPRAEYLDRLLRRDLALSLSLNDLYAPAHSRLALTLFLDYCWNQRLEPAEIASLLDDAQRDALEALSFVLGATLADAA